MTLDICNKRPFYVVILEGYSVAGVHIVVLGLSDRMSGCLGNLAPVFPPRRWRARRQHVGNCQFVSGAHSEQALRKYVSLFSDVVSCRNCKLYNVCDISMCCNLELTMYLNIYEDCVVNPRRDKCWILR